MFFNLLLREVEVNNDCHHNDPNNPRDPDLLRPRDLDHEMSERFVGHTSEQVESNIPDKTSLMMLFLVGRDHDKVTPLLIHIKAVNSEHQLGVHSAEESEQSAEHQQLKGEQIHFN